ncbi:hypothetical protein [Streptomyces sp. NBC_00272]|uniref:hypothetical protein n=1 Tax=Streptomyces sp. NBC_00272 TaxID=2975698 RepID=UPI002E29AF09|nr:hypothetical protein [Streptomyces sp. NBC_00272]
MSMYTLRRWMSVRGGVLGLSSALLLITGTTPAYAAASLSVTKTHEGNFARGGQGIYHIKVANSGDELIADFTLLTDTLPSGLTIETLSVTKPVGLLLACSSLNGGTGFTCESHSPLLAGDSYTVDLTVNIATDAPCTVTNTATVSSVDAALLDSASDPTTITGGDCNSVDGGSSSILPINLSGIVPLFNNISTNNNLLSPGATNATNQKLGINAP